MVTCKAAESARVSRAGHVRYGICSDDWSRQASCTHRRPLEENEHEDEEGDDGDDDDDETRGSHTECIQNCRNGSMQCAKRAALWQTGLCQRHDSLSSIPAFRRGVSGASGGTYPAHPVSQAHAYLAHPVTANAHLWLSAA
eukprot:1630351-Rhodomonas_salina.1